MNRIFQVVALFVLVLACAKKPAFEVSKPVIPEPGQTAVYYFRTSFVCETCEAIEDIVADELNTRYADELKDGKIIFRQFNLDDPETADFALRFDVVFKSLLVLKNDTFVNLTNEAFLYALPKPEKLRLLIDEQLTP